jgi:hypothetical protein
MRIGVLLQVLVVLVVALVLMWRRLGKVVKKGHATTGWIPVESGVMPLLVALIVHCDRQGSLKERKRDRKGVGGHSRFERPGVTYGWRALRSSAGGRWEGFESSASEDSCWPSSRRAMG